jgi:hypothetical protein
MSPAVTRSRDTVSSGTRDFVTDRAHRTVGRSPYIVNILYLDLLSLLAIEDNADAQAFDAIDALESDALRFHRA